MKTFKLSALALVLMLSQAAGAWPIKVHVTTRIPSSVLESHLATGLTVTPNFVVFESALGEHVQIPRLYTGDRITVSTNPEHVQLLEQLKRREAVKAPALVVTDAPWLEKYRHRSIVFEDPKVLLPTVKP